MNRQSLSVATMMLDTARNKREQAMQQLKAIGEKRKSLDTKTHKLLQKTIPSAQPPAKSLRGLCFVDAHAWIDMQCKDS